MLPKPAPTRHARHAGGSACARRVARRRDDQSAAPASVRGRAPRSNSSASAMPYTGSSAVTTVTVEAGRRARLADEECVRERRADDAEQPTSSSECAVTWPSNRPHHATTGATHSAAKAFCQSAIFRRTARALSFRLHGQQRECESRQHPHASPGPCDLRGEFRHEQNQPGGDQNGRRPFRAARNVVQQHRFEQRQRTAENSRTRGARSRPSRSGSPRRTRTNAPRAPRRWRRAATRRRPRDSRRIRSSAYSAAAAISVRPRTIVAGCSDIHLPKSPANPNSSTARCSDESDAARDERRSQVSSLHRRQCAIASSRARRAHAAGYIEL